MYQEVREVVNKVGEVDELICIKKRIAKLQEQGVVSEWELPYENLLTRKNAAIIYLNTESEENLKCIVLQLEDFGNWRFELNQNKTLSSMKYKIFEN